jgi:hypothetical protein
MMPTKRNLWGSFLCWVFGHIGNIRWGEYGPKGEMIHRCSCCRKPIRIKKDKEDHASK